MKPRQQAILDTVRRWAVITVTNMDSHSGCELCRLSRDVAGIFNPICPVCPYTEVFGRQCTEHFPKLQHGLETGDPISKLRRAMALARQYTVGEQAIAIVREVFGR